MPRNGKAITCDRHDRRAMETSWFSRTTAHTSPDRLGDSIHRAAVLTETAPVGRVVKPPNDTNQAVVEPGSSGAISDIELSRSAAVVWLVRTPTSWRWKGGGMAHESPPSRASPRPLAGVLGCLTAACAPAGIVTPARGLFLLVCAKPQAAFVMYPL